MKRSIFHVVPLAAAAVILAGCGTTVAGAPTSSSTSSTTSESASPGESSAEIDPATFTRVRAHAVTIALKDVEDIETFETIFGYDGASTDSLLLPVWDRDRAQGKMKFIVGELGDRATADAVIAGLGVLPTVKSVTLDTTDTITVQFTLNGAIEGVQAGGARTSVEPKLHEQLQAMLGDNGTYALSPAGKNWLFTGSLDAHADKDDVRELVEQVRQATDAKVAPGSVVFSLPTA